jgi:hypothetical protein
MASQDNTIFKDFVSITTPEAVSSGTTTPSEAPTEQPPFKRTWYRTTFFNATIVGLAAFAAPGTLLPPSIHHFPPPLFPY